MPIGTGIVYNVGDLILSQVSSSGTAFLETKIAAATSSLIYFDSNARINSASLNSITVGTASYVSGSNSIITNITASNISASGTSSFGYVGIGTNSPIYKLDLQNTSSTARLGNAIVGAWPVNTTFALFGHNNLDHTTSATNYALIQWNDGTTYLNASSGKNIYFRINNSDKMILNSSGQFGIGTTSPIAGFLDVRSNQTKSVAGPTNIAFFGSGDGGNPLGLVINHESSSGVKMVGLVGTEYGSSGNNIKINETLHVQYSGNVGIGTSNPSTILTLSKPIDAAAYGSGSRAIDFKVYYPGYDVDSVKASIYVGVSKEGTLQTTKGYLAFLTSATSGSQNLTEKMRIEADGNIGIGTTSPAYLLDVSGSTRHGYRAADNHYFTGSVNISGSLTLNGTFAPTSISASGTSSFGYVGIGTNSPVDKLTIISGSTRIASTALAGALYFGSDNSNIYLQRDNNYDLSLVQNGDSNSALYLASAGNVYINIDSNNNDTDKAFIVQNNALKAGTELFRVSETGNVGIGTTIPNNKLDMFGGTGTTLNMSNIDDSNRGGKLTFISSSVTGRQFYVGTNSSIYNLVFGIDSIEKMRLDTSGNLGIGTTSPGSRLEVQFPTNPATDNGAGNNVLRVWTSASFAADVGGAIGLGGTYNTSSYQSFGQIAGRKTNALSSSNAGYLQFATTNTNGTMTEWMRIDAGGNVGIGTTNPITKFHVYAAANGNNWASFAGNVGATLPSAHTYGVLIGSNYSNGLSESNIVWGHGISSNQYFAIGKVSGSTSYSEQLRIDVNGNVGIGTTVPVNKLQVNGNVSGSSFTSSISNAVGFLGTSSWAQNVVSASFATTAQTANALNPANSYTITNLTASNISASLTGSFGMVGIGTTSPTQKLDVAGSAYAYNYFTLLTAATYGPSDNSATMQVFGSTGSGGLTNTIKFVTGGSERWRITDAGILQSPAAQTIQTSTGNLTLATGGGNGNILLSPNGSGNVGIGTTLPNSKLEVAGASGTAIVSIHNTTLGRSGSFGIDSNGVYIQNSNNGDYFDLKNASGVSKFRMLYDSNTYITTTYTSVGSLTASGSKLSVFGNLSIGSSYGFTAAPSDGAIFEGNVGIGTTLPQVKLQVVTDASTPAAVPAAGTYGGAAIFGADLRTYGLYVGAITNGNGYVQAQRGDTATTYNLLLQPNGGSVGIGTTSPVNKLQVAGNISGSSFTSSISNAVGFLGTSSWAQNVVSASFATTAQTANALNASNTYTIAGLTSAYVDVNGSATIPSTGIYRPSSKTLGLSADATLILKINGSVSPYVTSIETGNFLVQSGNVGIGTTNATDKLTLYGELASYKTGADTIQTQVYLANAGNTRAFNLQLNSGGTGLDLWSYNSANAWLRHTTFNYDGNVGIGTAVPAAKLEITGSSNSALLNIKSPISGAILYVSGSGAVGIGTSAVGAFTLQVSGSFGATTKSFIIDHPTKEGKKLMYGSLESPYHGIRLTGRDTIKDGKCKVELPDYMYKLILHDSINIQLTGIKCNKTLYVDEINIPENYFTIAYDKGVFESYKDYDFFWDFTAIRADVPELNTEL